MFDKLKQLHQLKKMQDEFKKERITVEKRGVTVTLNGNFEVEDVILNPELNIEEQQMVVKDVLNEAKANVQKALAQKMMSSGMM
jgi:DNA-binding protein YbaB